MAIKTNIIAGLDIGTSNIKLVIADCSGVRPEILGVGEVQSQGLRKGVVINIESTVKAISQAIQQAEGMAGVEIHSVVCSLSGSHIKSFNSHGIVGIKNREVSAQDVEKVIDAAKAVAIPMDREILHVLPQEFIIDDQDGIKEPIGISGVRLEANVHIVTGAIASAQNIVKCANRCGLAVQDLVFSGLASAQSILTKEEQELGVCLIDIGGGTTDITVFKDGALHYSGVVSVGGNHITNDLAAGLRTPIGAAEELKFNYGTKSNNSYLVEVASTGERPSREIAPEILSEIIEPRVGEIFTLALKELARANCHEIINSGIVLTGESAKLKGVENIAEQVFQLPVRIGLPKIGGTEGLGGLVDRISNPGFACATGLVLRAAKTHSVAQNGSGRFKLTKLVRKVGNWFGETF